MPRMMMARKQPRYEGRVKASAIRGWMYEEDKEELRDLAAHEGVSMSDMITILVRNERRRRKLPVTDRPIDADNRPAANRRRYGKE